MRRTKPAAALALAALLLAGCDGAAQGEPPGSGDGAGRSTTSGRATTSTSTTTTIAPPPDQATLDAVALRLEEVGRVGEPVAFAVRPGDTRHLWIGERGGVVRRLVPGGAADAVLDLRGQVATTGEQGILGLAFSAEGDRLFLSYTASNDDSVVDEYTMAGDAPDPATVRTLLRLPQPSIVHNGGHILVDDEGLLWVALGDGGPVDAPDRAQDLGSLFGSLLRIDPTPTADAPYRIPPGNPFADRPGARPEIWAFGLRNPWRFSFDRATGDLWLGDVGQYAIEEIDHVAATAGRGAGANFGWRSYEGTHRRGEDLADHVPPVLDYNHDEGGCAVVGGHVYRGRAIPGLGGAYVFGDLCRGLIQAIAVADGAVVAQRVFDQVWVESLVSFGEDADGELYALSLAGGVYRLVPG